MGIPLFTSTEPVGWGNKLRDAVNYWFADTRANSWARGDDVIDDLNSVASAMGVATILEADFSSAFAMRTKINTILSALGLPDSADVYSDLTKGRYWDNGAPSSVAAKIVDTHAQAILVPDGAGGWISRAANVLCDGPLGLQTVPTRTNSLRNNSMTGAVAGNPGTLPTSWTSAGGPMNLTREIVGSGTSNGLPYIDVRFSGTSNASGSYGMQLEANTQVVAAQGQVWSGSLFAAIVAGSSANLTSIAYRPARGYTAASAATTDTAQVLLTAIDGTMRRFEGVATLADAATARVAPQFLIGFGNGAVIDVTFRIWAPQMELGGFATPPILTTAAAASRAGNQQIITGLSAQLSSGVAGFIKFNLPAIDVASAYRVIELHDGTANNRISICNVSGQFQLYVASGNVTQTAINLGVFAAGAKTIAFAVGANFAKARIVGGTDPAADTGVTLPVAPDRVALGGTGYSNSANAYQLTQKVELEFGAQNQASFDAMLALAAAA
jgi:hypothetical protein